MDQLTKLQQTAQTTITKTQTISELDKLRVQYLSKKGELNKLFQELLKTETNKKTLGQAFNQTKTQLEKIISEKQTKIQQLNNSTSRNKDFIDTTKFKQSLPIGAIHPINQMITDMNNFFKNHGFSIMDGPEIETDEFNFQKTNLPVDHPARDLQDTLYIQEPNVLLRTHTSSVETRVLDKYEPPLRIVVPGKVYRYETVNPSNNVMFFQYQGLAIDKNINMSNLKWLLEEFIKHFYGKKQKTRFRCKYYPEVEPTAGFDLACTFCNQKGCPVCKYRGWLEMIGCGMVHPNILKMANLDPDQWQGFAWGMGLDRLVMTRYHISDIRDLTNGSITYPYL